MNSCWAKTSRKSNGKHSVGDCSTNISDLPNEILVHIFSFLNIKERIRTERVCKRWRDIGQNVLWSSPNELDVWALKRQFFENDVITDDVVSNVLARCGASLKRLVFLVNTDAQEGKVVRRPHINSDENFAEGCLLTNVLTCEISRHCRNLTELRLDLAACDECAPPCRKQMDRCILINLAKDLTKLKKVFFRYVSYLDDATLSEFLSHSHSLEYLLLRHCDELTLTWMDFVSTTLRGFYMYNCRGECSTNVALKLLQQCPDIEEMGIGGYYTVLTLPVLEFVLPHYSTTLKTLYLEMHFTMEPLEWCGIPELIPNIEVLSLRGAIRLDDNMLLTLAEKCPKLHSLDVSGTRITDFGMSVLSSLPSLKVLDVTKTNITGKGISSVASKGLLERFYVGLITQMCTNTEAGCILLANCCPHIYVVDLSRNMFITEKLVWEFSDALERGVLQGPVSLYLHQTLVKEGVECSDKLNLYFKDFPDALRPFHGVAESGLLF